jgi:hypothetical protein
MLKEQHPIAEDSPSQKNQEEVNIFELDKMEEETPDEQINRPSVYSPIKNRESFIEKKIKAITDDDKTFGRQSLEAVDFRPRLSVIGQEQAELKQQREEIEAAAKKLVT